MFLYYIYTTRFIIIFRLKDTKTTLQLFTYSIASVCSLIIIRREYIKQIEIIKNRNSFKIKRTLTIQTKSIAWAIVRTRRENTIRGARYTKSWIRANTVASIRRASALWPEIQMPETGSRWARPARVDGPLCGRVSLWLNT